MRDKEQILKCIIGLGASALITAGSYALHAAQPEPAEPVVTAAAASVSAADIVYQKVDAPEASSADGVVSAQEWAEIYPEITASFQANSENSYHVSYLEETPFLSNIYEGYGFAKDYESARGHNYGLEDVHATQRPHATANCLTCKSPNFTKMVNDQGVAVYSMDFEEVYGQMNEFIGCYNCHENLAGNGGELVVTHSYVKDCLGDNLEKINPAILSCGQCHIEYYFKPDTKETSMPYDGPETMNPTSILAFYDEIGFSDWTQESTGTPMLKAQHPEMETMLSGKHGALLSCADCHMAVTKADNGTVYHSHKWESPLENEAILATCASCHGQTDMAALVHGIQEEITGRETEVGSQLSDLKDSLAAAVESGSLPEETLDQVRSLYRTAQWYWDFCYVENSEGAHNSALARECMDTSEEKIKEAMALLEA